MSWLTLLAAISAAAAYTVRVKRAASLQACAGVQRDGASSNGNATGAYSFANDVTAVEVTAVVEDQLDAEWTALNKETVKGCLYFVLQDIRRNTSALPDMDMRSIQNMPPVAVSNDVLQDVLRALVQPGPTSGPQPIEVQLSALVDYSQARVQVLLTSDNALQSHGKAWTNQIEQAQTLLLRAGVQFSCTRRDGQVNLSLPIATGEMDGETVRPPLKTRNRA